MIFARAGLGRARRLVLSGEMIGPDEALGLGLVDYLVPVERLEEGLTEVVVRQRTCRAAGEADDLCAGVRVGQEVVGPQGPTRCG